MSKLDIVRMTEIKLERLDPLVPYEHPDPDEIDNDDSWPEDNDDE